ncbi:EAL domain-containing protein [Sphingomonas sp. DT-207]|uniref:EAL domain-containing protein n=1 Tax=Sphingomonas sp. DT-207 TaxID=3396167 RepID=UPI003F1C3CC1
MRRHAFRTDAVSAAELARPEFQPILEVESGRTVAWEANARRQEALDRQRIERAVAIAVRADLLETGAMLAMPLRTTEAPDEIAAHLACTAVAYGLSPRRLLVQVRADEHCEADRVAALARACRGRGMKVALHSFSAGPRGMRLLAETRPHFLALDPALTRDLAASPSRRRMVEAVLRLARDLGATVIATDITKGADLMSLHRLGAPLFQSEAFRGIAPQSPGAGLSSRWPAVHAA